MSLLAKTMRSSKRLSTRASSRGPDARSRLAGKVADQPK